MCFVKNMEELFPGEKIMAHYHDKVNSSIMGLHSFNLWEWSAKEDHTLTMMLEKQPPDMQNCGFRVLFEIKQEKPLALSLYD